MLLWDDAGSMRRFIWLLGALLMSNSLALAHDLWVEKRQGEFGVHRGHRGGELMPIALKDVLEVRCLTPDGQVRKDLHLQGNDFALTVSQDCVAFALSYSGGEWCLTPNGEKNLPRERCLGAVQTWSSLSVGKWVSAPSPLSFLPLGARFEILPVTDLATVRTGDKATFRVLLDGAPVEGALVTIGHKTLGETNKAGEIRVKIRATDLETISAAYRRPVPSVSNHYEIFEGSLSFEVAR